jgi:hypothetical protein
VARGLEKAGETSVEDGELIEAAAGTAGVSRLPCNETIICVDFEDSSGLPSASRNMIFVKIVSLKGFAAPSLVDFAIKV